LRSRLHGPLVSVPCDLVDLELGLIKLSLQRVRLGTGRRKLKLKVGQAKKTAETDNDAANENLEHERTLSVLGACSHELVEESEHIPQIELPSNDGLKRIASQCKKPL
jgi:hypothetical protein